MSAIDNIAPMKEVRIKQRTQPWITNEILQCINDRDKAFRVYKKDSSDDIFSNFKELRNKTQTMIYTAKRDYFKENVEMKTLIRNTYGMLLRSLICLPKKVILHQVQLV